MIPTETPFQFKRLQFPIRLAFAVTINKTEGQSLELCGLDLDADCFSHGQLYVACSRFGKPDSLYVYADNGKTKKYCLPTRIARLNLYKTYALLSYSFHIHATRLCHSEAWQGNPSLIYKNLVSLCLWPHSSETLNGFY